MQNLIVHAGELGVDSAFEYAVDVLRVRLAELNIQVQVADPVQESSRCSPVLFLLSETSDPLGGQEFTVDWQPENFDSSLLSASFWFTASELPESVAVAKLGKQGLRNTIRGGSPAGVLYGVLEFCERCEAQGGLPRRPLRISRTPQLPIRSACLQLMKAGKYDLDITPEEFPWFFDLSWWTRYLDFMASRRFNVVTLWNFHPFPFFVHLERHRDLHVLPAHRVESNRVFLRRLVEEARRRSIRLVFHFYNIYVSHAFARSIGMPGIRQFSPEQEPLVCRYMADCVTSFTREFPEIGLMACLGEGVPGGTAERFAGEVLLPAVVEGGGSAPFIVRQWSTLTPGEVKRHILGRYPNLLVMIKHNAEHIASALPDARLRDWTGLGVPCLVNMHMLSEVAPFRWAPPDFIRELCLNYQALGAAGVHIYPHWSWRTPGVGDVGYVGEETERDWLYHSAWGRYAFDPVRDADEEDRYWVRSGASRFGGQRKAEAVVSSLNTVALTLPRIQQHLWIHYDNHSILSAGFTLGQLAEARSLHGRLLVLTDRHDDLVPLADELDGRPVGITGHSLDGALDRSETEVAEAIKLLESAGADPGVGDEAGWHLRDAVLTRHVLRGLRTKAAALRSLTTYFKTSSLEALDDAVRHCEESMVQYRSLAEKGVAWYESISDVDPLYPVCMTSAEMPYNWDDLLPVFEAELASVQRFRSAIRQGLPVAIAYRLGSYRNKAWDGFLQALEASRSPLWLSGTVDFLPIEWIRDNVDTIAVCLTDYHGWSRRIVPDFEGIFLEWMHRRPGRRMVFLSKPDPRWPDGGTLNNGLVKLNLCALTACGYDREERVARLDYAPRVIPDGRVGISGNLEGWEVEECFGGIMLKGSLPVGKSRIEFISSDFDNHVRGAGGVL